MLAADCQAQVFCLQETKLSENGKIYLKGFDTFYKNKILEQGQHAHGGVAILASQKCSKYEINLNTRLQAVAISIKLNKRITICSIYIPPGDLRFSQRELEDLIRQLPAPFMLLGDFNAKNEVWYGETTDAKGRIIENVLHVTNMHFLDKDKDTHIYHDGVTGALKSSHIDLSLCSTNLLADYEWGLYDQTLDSDHYPVWLRAGQGRRSVSFPKWVIDKADWPKFTAEASPIMRVSEFDNVSEANSYCKTFIVDAAKESIPKTSGEETFYRSPGWNKDCTKYKRNRAKDWKKYKKKEITKVEWNRSKAKTRQIINWAKQSAWLKYMDSINGKTPLKEVWRKIKVFTNNYKSSAVTTLKVEGEIIDDYEEIANCIGEVFAKISSEENCSQSFLRYKRMNEKKINFKTNDKFSYNNPITMKELKASLDDCGDTATGPDEVHNRMLKNLPEQSKGFLLDLLNYIFKEGVLPEDWKLAHIIPILKKDKDPLDPKSYRPISLLSCLSKILGKILNCRLVWFLETNDCLHKSQNGSRKGRSPLFNLLDLENEIHDAFLQNKLLVTIFFDLEKAYDTCWGYLILRELYDFGLRGNLPTYIENYLSERQFQVRVGNKLSRKFTTEMGVPQGGILSVTLFIIAMNTVTKHINNKFTFGIFVDDLRVSYLASLVSGAQRQLNLLLKEFLVWMNETGFRFSTTKTKAIIFRRGRWPDLENTDLKLRLGNSDIEVVEKIKFLGQIWDEKLTWKLQIAALKRSCMKSINAMKIMIKHSRSADTNFLLRIYKSIIRSKLDYGCEVYGTAPVTRLESLDPVHNAGLRLVTGAYRTTNAQSLYVLTNEPSLELRRSFLQILHFFRAKKIPERSKVISWEDPILDPVYTQKSNVYFKPESYGFKTRKAVDELELPFIPQITEIRNYTIPPWEFHKINICFALAQYIKSDTTPEKFQQEFLAHKHPVEIEIYTDGSKIAEKVGSGVVIKNGRSTRCFPVRMQDHSSVFGAELFAIRAAILKIKDLQNTTCCIYSDSKSALEAINKFYSNHPIVQVIQEQINLCKIHNSEVMLCWIPGHVGIEGNNLADKVAKDATKLNTKHFKKVSFSDVKELVRTKITQKWQQKWNILVNGAKTPLAEIILKVNQTKHCEKLTRTECLKYNRLRVGHTKFVKQFMVKQEEVPECLECGTILTVKHVLVECGNYYHERNTIFGRGPLNIRELLTSNDESSIRKVLQFFKDINLYNNI